MNINCDVAIVGVILGNDCGGLTHSKADLHDHFVAGWKNRWDIYLFLLELNSVNLLQSIFGCSLGFSNSGASDAVATNRRAFHGATVSWLDKNLQNTKGRYQCQV
jgi:hypothetical protein